MSDNERKEFVDELLNTSLNRYSQVEPRAGLEERLLASVPQAAQRSAWLQWVGIPAAATAVVLIAALAFYATRQQAPASPSPAVAQTPAPTLPAPVVSAPVAAPHPSISRRTVEGMRPAERLVAGPRLATFPARAPLSEQERLLLLFVQQTPKEQLMARQLGAGPIERLEIQPLSVPPLESQKSTNEN